MEYQEAIDRYLQLEETDMRKRVFKHLLGSLYLFSQQHIVRKKLIKLERKTIQESLSKTKERILTQFYIQFLEYLNNVNITDESLPAYVITVDEYQEYLTSKLKTFKYQEELKKIIKDVYDATYKGDYVCKFGIDFPENMSYYESFQLSPEISLEEAFNEHFTPYFKDTILSNFFSSEQTPYLFIVLHVAAQLSKGIVQMNSNYKTEPVITHTGYDGWLKAKAKNLERWQKVDKIIAINAYCKHYMEGLKNG